MNGTDEWLSNLKAGDEVAIRCGFGDDRYSFRMVDRATKTQIIVGTQKFSRNRGRLIGSERWNYTYLEQPTPEIRERIDIEKRRSRASSIIRSAKLDYCSTITEMPIEKLEAIAAVIARELGVGIGKEKD